MGSHQYFIDLSLDSWVSIQAGAETLNFKSYTWVTRGEIVPIGDVEGHHVTLIMRGTFYVFENGELATGDTVTTSDLTKGSGSFRGYTTIKFGDGSTIMVKTQGTLGGTAAGALGSSGATSEIIKGAGRFEGIKGTMSTKTKYLPVEKGEVAPKGYGEGTITYTLPGK